MPYNAFSLSEYSGGSNRCSETYSAEQTLHGLESYSDSPRVDLSLM